ncbi:MAG: hypothetical protein JWR79_1225 [Tardiphaga sp.]|nr:hypothetical protein [Tardiphaga sp.]
MSSKMPPTTSRDIESEPPRKDSEREQQAAVIKDADKTEQADRERIHGDGKDIGLNRE